MPSGTRATSSRPRVRRPKRGRRPLSVELLVNIDVDNLARAAAFYTTRVRPARGASARRGWSRARRWLSRIYLLHRPEHDYRRHWTPVHLVLPRRRRRAPPSPAPSPPAPPSSADDHLRLGHHRRPRRPLGRRPLPPTPHRPPATTPSRHKTSPERALSERAPWSDGYGGPSRRRRGRARAKRECIAADGGARRAAATAPFPDAGTGHHTRRVRWRYRPRRAASRS